MKQMYSHLEDKFRDMELDAGRKMDISDHDHQMKEMRDTQLNLQHKYQVTQYWKTVTNSTPS